VTKPQQTLTFPWFPTLGAPNPKTLKNRSQEHCHHHHRRHQAAQRFLPLVKGGFIWGFSGVEAEVLSFFFLPASHLTPPKNRRGIRGGLARNGKLAVGRDGFFEGLL